MAGKKFKEYLEKLSKSVFPVDEEEQNLYKEYITSLRDLNRKMDSYYTEDEKGDLPTLDENGKKDFLNDLIKAAKAGEAFLAYGGDKKNEKKAPVYEMIDKLQDILAKNFKGIKDYNPASKKTLKEIQTESKSTTIDLKGKYIKTLGNQQSSRIPMTIYDNKGRGKTGVFTKASRVQFKGTFDKAIEKAKGECTAAGAAELDKMLATMKNGMIASKYKKLDDKVVTDKISHDYVLGAFLHELRMLRDYRKNSTVKSGDMKRLMRDWGVDTNQISGKAMSTIKKAVDTLLDSPGAEINGHHLELPDGSRLDNRNSAMSAVARLLDVSHLLAKSENMKYVDENGNVVEGTFMEFGKGIDLINNPDLYKHISNSPLVSNEKARNSFMKSLVDLQVLDALCLNVDRHSGNVMYQVDKDGNFVGVQGIDNDSSFGRNLLREDQIKSMRFISADMSSKLKSLTPSMLKFALRGNGLEDEEIDAACKRLKQLKDAIAQNKIRVIKNNKCYGIDDSNSAPEKGKNNIFSQILKDVQDVARERRMNNPTFVPYTEKTPTLPKVSTLERRFTVSGLIDAAEKVDGLLNNKIKGFRLSDIDKFGRRSNEFTNMLDAAKIVKDLPDSVKKIPGFKSQNLLTGDNVPKEVLETLDLGFDNLKQTITTYLGKKMRERRAATTETLEGKNKYEQSRIDFAKSLLNIVNDYEAIRRGPSTEKEIKMQNKLTDKRIAEENKIMKKKAMEIAGGMKK
ncbi:MAG: hypothetical protein IKR27_02435 [Lachnospiraceae bacterium]|nr:hypothetical protein [Lachnospiraceae bacterium]